jgi:HSP20 family protein
VGEARGPGYGTEPVPAAPGRSFAQPTGELHQEAIMNEHKLALSVAAIALLGLVGSVGAATEHHQKVAGSEAPQAQQQAPGDESIGSTDPWAEMRRMQARMDRMFEEAMQRFHSDRFFQPLADEEGIAPEPKVTLREEEDRYVIEADMPAAQAENIDVGLDGRLLTLSARTQGARKQSDDQGQVIEEEHYTSSFERAFTLPGPVTASGMHSDYQDGVLTVTVPKAHS